MITAIDLGSNSFRAINFDCTKLAIIDDFEQTVRTADKLAYTGEISKEALDRIIEAIQTAQIKLGFDPKNTICKTTAAMRKATNSSSILESIRHQTNLNFEIISGEEEARLTLLAIQHALKRENMLSDDFIVLDIGGGSTELTIVQKNNKYSKSFDIGIVTLTQHFDQNLMSRVQTQITEFIKNLDLSKTKLIATAGTPTTIAAIKMGLTYATYDRKIINGTKLTLDDLHHFKSKLTQLDSKTLGLLVGEARAEFMNAGAAIFEMIFGLINAKESIVFDDGLREGIAIDFCLNHSHKL